MINLFTLGGIKKDPLKKKLGFTANTIFLCIAIQNFKWNSRKYVCSPWVYEITFMPGFPKGIVNETNT